MIIIENPLFCNDSRFDGFFRAFPVGIDKSGYAEFGASEIAYHHNEAIGNAEGIYLA